ncbi:MAG: tetraacyldisaccharide 4'-kinase [Bacteroidales bacterium]|jgi:tetraacyldisaccharide 4'-kinase|nr:tetraacyldisaccharide 4'-kinase [Bacteroidales bacterium]
MKLLLFPFSLLYGIITFVRNRLYDWKWIPSVQYDDVYVIGVGNITVGGTGKTPFVEYLARLLSQDCRVAVLSRGYKRTTRGFRFVDDHSTPGETGDEPYQIKRKFPGIVVAVDASRVEGIARIRSAFPDIQVILLDDAFQYRRIRPNLSIILTDYNRPLYRDGMLPGGRLREWPCFARRADVMVVTGSPAGMSVEEQQNIAGRYSSIFPHALFFAAVRYGEPLTVFPHGKPLPASDLQQYDVLLVTGIASPGPFEAYMRQRAASVQTVTYPDHHAFSARDVKNIIERWNAIRSTHKILMTTEKDAVRLQQTAIPDRMAKCSYYVPIEVDFTGGESDFHFLVSAAGPKSISQVR